MLGAPHDFWQFGVRGVELRPGGRPAVWWDSLEREILFNIVFTPQDHQPAQAVLVDKMSQEVTVTGTLVKKGGTQMIYVKSVK